MSNPLTLTSSFCKIWPVIDDRAEWDRLVKRTCGTLSSLSQIEENRKYYFYEKDSKFYKSTWWIADSLETVGVVWNSVADSMAKCEEGAYRKFWRLSHNDVMEGLYSAHDQIMDTLAMALGSLEPDVKKLDIDLPSLENDIQNIYKQCQGAYLGIHKLAFTYETDLVKKDVLMPAVEAFCEEINRVVLKVLARMKKVQEGSLTPLTEVVFSSFLPVPFLNPISEDQREFNADLQSNYVRMKEHVERNQEMIEKMKESKTFQRSEEYTPWPIEVTETGNIYFDYNVSIVPAGQGGQFKKDMRGYCVTRGIDIAKLTTKKPLKKEKDTASVNEERFLKLFMEKKFPNVVETFDIFWEQNTLFIYQKYCANGNLESSLQRLNDQPEKKKMILTDVFMGLSYLHGEEIVHCDIKPGNILLDVSDTAYLCDFGLTCYLSEADGKFRGSPYFAEPGLFCGGPLTYSSDIWSLGMTMFGLLSNSTVECPWPWLADANVAFDIPKCTRRHLKAKFPEPKKEDLWWHSCWETLNLESGLRPTAKQLIDRLGTTVVQPK